jgi:hypothetical protein
MSEICWFPFVDSADELNKIVNVADFETLDMIFEELPSPSMLTPVARTLWAVSE